MDKWLTFNDDKTPRVFYPFEHSGDSYMYVYRRVDVGEVVFPPTVLPENIERVGEILKAYPSTNRGKLASKFHYPPRSVSTTEICTLAQDIRQFQERVEVSLRGIISSIGELQVGMVQLQEQVMSIQLQQQGLASIQLQQQQQPRSRYDCSFSVFLFTPHNCLLFVRLSFAKG